MLAIMIQASALAVDASKSLGRRRLRPSQAKVRFDHPPPRLGLEGPDALRTGDDLDFPRAHVGECVEQFWAPVDTIGEDMAQLAELSPSAESSGTAP